MNSLKTLLVTGLATGYVPVAPGTAGSAAAAGVFLAAAAACGGSVACTAACMAVLAAAATAGCVVLGPFAERRFGRRDPGPCTLDEWAGQAVACMLRPLGDTWSARLAAAATAFIAFRAFDIAKPPPVRRMERFSGGWGIVADDLAAGVYANVAAQIALRLVLPRLLPGIGL